MTSARSLLVAGALLLGAALPAQEENGEEAIAKTCEQWLASEHTDKELLTKSVRAVLKDSKIGLPWLGKLLPAALAKPDLPRSKGVNELCLRVTLEFLRRQYKSGMFFVGQYKPLEALQPFAGDLLFRLLLDTPDWYPFTFRVRLVPALRDLQTRIVDGPRLDALVELIQDMREPQDLRWALAAMLHQWERTQYAEQVVNELRAATVEGDAEDRVLTTLQLADYYCLLRDYKSSARAHRSAQALAKSADVPLQPVAWYAAACVHALLGDKDKGFEALTRCARMHASPHLDRSQRLERKLFEKDPEIELLRKDERFAELLKLAFGDEKPDEKSDDESGDDNGR